MWSLLLKKIWLKLSRKMSTLEELRNECSRLFFCKTLKDSNEVLDIYAEFLFLTVQNHHKTDVYSTADADAKIVLQMMLTKVLHLKGILKGITFKSENGGSLNNIIDPTIVASFIRNIYETAGMFNLIYRKKNTADEKLIVHLLWVHAGLMYRQGFEGAIKKDENREKFEDEKKQIEYIASLIDSNDLFKKLDDRNKNKIRTKLKEKDYKIRFDDVNVTFLSWWELAKEMDLKEDLWNNMYTYFSLYAHPSNVAVFQFQDMFGQNEESFLKLTNFNVQNSFYLISTFISDYINLFPEVLKTFESLKLRDQIVINYFNVLMRGREYSINNSAKALG